MKIIRIVFIAAALLAADACLATEEQTVIRLSEPVEATAEYETFGAPLNDAVPQVALEQIARGDESLIGETVSVVTRIKEVCQKKGCFFIAQEGSSIVRVSFKDYGFFVPTDISGKRITLVGEVITKEMTDDEAEHFAADLGGDGVAIEPGKALEILAESVRIPRGS